MNQEKIGNFIKQIRKNNNMTQAELAKKYGVTYQAVSNWEHGKNLPDVSLLKQMSNDFNISMDELLDGEKITVKKRRKKLYFSLAFIAILLLIIFLIIFINKNDNFEFKTISSNCSDFNISGSISYNDKKTSIYINNVNYCGGDDDTEYSNIECVLYEQNNNIETKIDTCKYKKNDNINLEDFLKSVEFTVDDYSRNCKKFSNESLYLKINATDNKGKTTTYKIPLSLNETCKN